MARMMFDMTARNLAAAITLVFAASAAAGAQTPGGPRSRPWSMVHPCASALALEIPSSAIGPPTRGARIVSAAVRPGSGADVPLARVTPSYCEVTGFISPMDVHAPNINFQVVIPAGWTGSAWQVGGNGADGFIPLLVELPRDFAGSPVGPTLPPHSPGLVGRGYAAYGGDSGHQGAKPPGPPTAATRPEGATPPDASWVKNEEAYRNEAYEQVKKTHDAAMAVFRALYGKPPALNYFGGESQGGRAALQAAARYPRDYDGVLSAAPLLYFSGVIAARPLRQKAQAEPGAWIPPAKRALIAKETQRLCDGLDGIVDGVISNYAACNRLVDPRVTPDPFRALRCPGGSDTGDTCLSDPQLKTLDILHGRVEFGVRLANGETFSPGFPAGLEDRPGWAEVGPRAPDMVKPPATAAAYHLTVRYADHPGAGDLYKTPPQDMADTLRDLSAKLDVPEDLSAFFARGGKLLLYASATDYLANSNGQIRYFDQMSRRVGKSVADRQARFYVNPFAPHGSTSSAYGTDEPLPHYADLIGALSAWVEQGRTPSNALPQTLEATLPPYTVTRSRPLCRYPTYPRYVGTGDAKVASSYRCAA